MSYRNRDNPDFPFIIKLGKAARDLRCGCTKRCHAKIMAGDPIAFIRYQHPSLGGMISAALTMDHFNKYFEEAI